MQELNRCHFGFRLPSSLAEPVKQTQQEIRRRGADDSLKFAQPHEIAIILLSLGELSPASMKRACEVAAPIAAKCPRYAVNLAGVGGSPNNVMPKTVWIGIVDEPGYLKLFADALRGAMAGIVPLPDHNPFELQVEIGRLRSFNDRARGEIGRALKMTQDREVGSFPIETLELLVNEAGPSGPYLRAVETLPLSS